MPIITFQTPMYSRPAALRVEAWAQLMTVLMLASTSAVAGTEWSAGTSVETLYNDNISRSPVAAHVVSDTSVELALWRGLHLQLADYTALQLQGTLTRQQFDHYSGLSNTRLSGSAEITHKFGLGTEVPVLAFATVFERSLFNDSRRNQSLYRASVAIRQRIHEQWQWSLIASAERQDGDHDQSKPVIPPALPLPGNVWDLHARQLAFNTEWDLGPATWLSTTLSWRDGDIVASTPPYPFILAASSAVTLDPLFGAGVVAYRLSAITRTAALDLNRAIGDSSTLYLGAERQWSHSANSLGYQVGIIRAGFLHNF